MGKKRICIATADLAELVRNSGVGTVYSSLADCLSRDFDVTVLFCAPWSEEDERFADWQMRFNQRGIRLLSVREPQPGLNCGPAIQRSYAAYLTLKDLEFDLIHFPDYLGLGYYSTLAKKMGCAFQSTQIVSILNGPHEWIHEHSHVLPSTPDELTLYRMERESVRGSDHLISPSQYALDWAQKQGWDLPPSRAVMFYPLPPLPEKSPRKRSADLKEIVFFGRLETRKGLEEFVEALDCLPARFLDDKTVTFLGRHGHVGLQTSQQYLELKKRKWKFKVRVIDHFSQQEALAYLNSGSRLAVIPSHAETLGYTVIECARSGIPFIASNIPPFREMFPAEDNQHLFFDLDPFQIAGKIEWAVSSYKSFSSCAYTEAVNQRWVEWHKQVLRQVPRAARPPLENSKVSIILTHRERPHFLRRAIQSLREQTYQNLEIIVCDDGSTDKATRVFLKELRQEGVLVLQSSVSKGPGYQRNRGAQHASGEWLLFMDDDNIAKSHEVQSFLEAAHVSGMDLITCVMDVFEVCDKSSGLPKVKSTWIPLGPDPVTSVFYNVFGDMNCFIRKKVFDAIGGVSELRDVAFEDYHLFVRALAKGFRVGLLPEALFYYRFHSQSYSTSASVNRTLRFRIESVKNLFGENLKGLVPLLFAWKYRLNHAEGGRSCEPVPFLNPNRKAILPAIVGQPPQFSSITTKALIGLLGRNVARKDRKEGVVWTQRMEGFQLNLPSVVAKNDYLAISWKILSPKSGKLSISFEEGGKKQVQQVLKPGVNHVYVEIAKPTDMKQLFVESSLKELGLSDIHFYA